MAPWSWQCCALRSRLMPWAQSCSSLGQLRGCPCLGQGEYRSRPQLPSAGCGQWGTRDNRGKPQQVCQLQGSSPRLASLPARCLESAKCRALCPGTSGSAGRTQPSRQRVMGHFLASAPSCSTFSPGGLSDADPEFTEGTQKGCRSHGVRPAWGPRLWGVCSSWHRLGPKSAPSVRFGVCIQILLCCPGPGTPKSM